MKIKIIPLVKSGWIWSIALSCLLCNISCTEEKLSGDSSVGGDATMNVSVDTRTGVETEETVRTVRIVTVNNIDKKVIYNKLFTTPAGNGLYEAKANVGENDFYVFCNETPAMTTQLQAVGRVTDIERVTLEAAGVKLPLPMFANMKKVFIETNAEGKTIRVTTEDGTVSDKLEVPVKRLVAKLSFTAIKNISSGDDFTVSDLKLRIVRRPRYSYIGEFQPYTDETLWESDLTVEAEGDQTLAVGNNGDYNPDHTVPTGTDKIEIPAVYLPEHLLTNREAREHCTYLMITARCHLQSGQESEANYRVDLGQSTPVNYNLYRNTNYRVFARITSLGVIGFHADIVPMDMRDISIGWKPVDGLVIVGDLATDFDANASIWNDYGRYSGILKIVNKDTYKPALFKYGSVVALSAEGNAFDPTTGVLWKPQSFTSAINGWSDIPAMASGDIPLPNTAGNVARGMGDPCRLVGLTQEQISKGIVDNNTWRMATSEEYGYLIGAVDFSNIDTRGFSSFGGYHVLPGSGVRDASGTLFGSTTAGGYWSSLEMQALLFASDNSSSLGSENGQNAYQIRCIRNSGVPKSSYGANGGNTNYTGGNTSIGLGGNAVAYWKAEFISGDASAITINGPVEGRFTGGIPITVQPLPDVYAGRTWTFSTTGYGLDGEIYSQNASLAQYALSHYSETIFSPAPPVVNGYGRIPLAGGTYRSKLKITPALDFARFPAARWQVQVWIPGQDIKLYSGWGTLDGEVECTIPENNTGDLRTIKIYVNFSGTLPALSNVSKTFIQDRQ